MLTVEPRGSASIVAFVVRVNEISRIPRVSGLARLIVKQLTPKVESASLTMSLMFKPPAEFNPDLVQVMFNENALLIKIVTEYQNKGKVYECMKYQDILTRNLLYLSGLSDFQADENFDTKTEKLNSQIEKT